MNTFAEIMEAHNLVQVEDRGGDQCWESPLGVVVLSDWEAVGVHGGKHYDAVRFWNDYDVISWLARSIKFAENAIKRNSI